MSISTADFERALQVGRPPNIQKLFPNSRALIVSGKAVDRAMLEKGKCMTIAANARSEIVMRGALMAAQRADATLILEIAKSEGTYCAINFWNIARTADAIMNELGITVPVAIHADHYGLKSPADVEDAKTHIPSIFDAGVTSIAVDASHMPDDENLLANIALNPYIPAWAGYETEIGEIKGKHGLSNPEEALFLIQGLNAHGIHPDWIALNNGTTHGIEAAGEGIQVELTAKIHEALAPYHVSGAQHGTSGNSSDRLARIAAETRTTKANVATALQMISWGVKVNDYGNAELDAEGNFIKDESLGMPDEMWNEMVEYAMAQEWKGGLYKKLNLPFECKILSLPQTIRDRMAKGVEDFVHGLLTDVFNADGTAPMAVNALLEAGSADLGPKVGRIEDPTEWDEVSIRTKAKELDTDKGPEGDWDD